MATEGGRDGNGRNLRIETGEREKGTQEETKVYCETETGWASGQT